MPIHDWTRVTPGTYHQFHHHWLSQVELFLNGGNLPDDLYAMVEQVVGEKNRHAEPDVLALRDLSIDDDEDYDGAGGDPAGRADDGGLLVAHAPPKVSVMTRFAEARVLLHREKQIVIRAVSGDRPVALVEIVSPGNKSSRRKLRQFLDKTTAALAQGVHVLLIDPFPPNRLHPQGMHGLIADEIGIEGGGTYEPPPDRPLTLVAYEADGRGEASVTAYVEPTAVGVEAAEMPLFIAPGRYVNVPLARTYADAFAAVPARWRRVIEA